MSQRAKCFQHVPTPDLVSADCEPVSPVITSAADLQAAGTQPSMRRYIHPVPTNDTGLPNQHSALLHAMEQQNALLTDLIGAVNGLTALICSRSS